MSRELKSTIINALIGIAIAAIGVFLSLQTKVAMTSEDIDRLQSSTEKNTSTASANKEQVLLIDQSLKRLAVDTKEQSEAIDVVQKDVNRLEGLAVSTLDAINRVNKSVEKVSEASTELRISIERNNYRIEALEKK